MNIYIPIIIVVLANTFYHVCTKSTPADINPFAALSITYLVGALTSLGMFFITQKSANLLAEYRHLNWTSFVLGIAIVGLEAGFIYMYKVGWNVSTGQLVASALLAIVLIFVGWLIYHEVITAEKLIGIVICLVGLYFINK